MSEVGFWSETGCLCSPLLPSPCPVRASVASNADAKSIKSGVFRQDVKLQRFCIQQHRRFCPPPRLSPRQRPLTPVYARFRIFRGEGYGTPALPRWDMGPLELADIALGFLERHPALNTVAVRRIRSLLLLHMVMTDWWL